MKTGSTDNFYTKLSSFDNFNQVADDSQFALAPEDWKVIITDIAGSTKAIEEGRYKDTNTLGVATIVAAQNAMAQEDFPFVFGGDGASLLIPPKHVKAVKQALIEVQKIALKNFSMQLRIGIVDLAEIYAENVHIKIAKYKLVANKSIAVFKGGGLAHAENKVKNETDKYAIKGEGIDQDMLEGLSCRWQPIPSSRGIILSILIQAKDNQKYVHVMEFLNSLFDGNIENACPVQNSVMKYKNFSECFHNERRLHNSIFSSAFIKRMSELFFGMLALRYKVQPLRFFLKGYLSSIDQHSDFLKFDEMLRMVIDCTEIQKQKIYDFLDEQHRAGSLIYGIHCSSHAQMTCYLSGISEGEHIHFIDGGNGGYAMAAKQFKNQAKGL